MAEAGFATVGFDSDQKKIDSPRAQSYIRHVPSARLTNLPAIPCRKPVWLGLSHRRRR
jgi:hypothetical protein